MVSDNVYLICREEHLMLIGSNVETFDDSRPLGNGEIILEARLLTADARERLESSGVKVLSAEEARAYVRGGSSEPRQRKRRQANEE